MPRYHFHLHECGVFIPDEEGRDLPDGAAARAAAFHEARALMSAEVQRGTLCLSCHIDIVDEAQALVATIPFRDALAVTGL